MSHGHPTLADLRATVQKQRHREIGNWLAQSSRSTDGRVWKLGRRPPWPVGAPGDSGRPGCEPGRGVGDRNWLSGGLRAGRGAGSPGLLAGSCGRPGRSLARHGLPGWGLSRLRDAPYGQLRPGIRSGVWTGQPVGSAGLGPRRVCDRWGLGATQFAQRLPLQGLLSTPQERGRHLPRRRRQRQPAFAPGVLAEAWHRTLELAFVQGLRAARGFDDHHGIGRSGRCPPVALAFLLAILRPCHGHAGPLAGRGPHCPLRHARIGGSRVLQVVPPRRSVGPRRSDCRAVFRPPPSGQPGCPRCITKRIAEAENAACGPLPAGTGRWGVDDAGV